MFCGEEEKRLPQRKNLLEYSYQVLIRARNLKSTKKGKRKGRISYLVIGKNLHFIDGGRASKVPDAMDRMDADMMETEATASSSTVVPPQQQGSDDGGKGLLTVARNLINEGKPAEALQVVVMAVRNRGGGSAVLQSLDRARQVYRARMQQNNSVDQLASLFAECAIAEAEPSKDGSLPCNPTGPSVASDSHGISILAQTGRLQIVLDAASDGSSFICLQCGGLVSNHRKEEHYAYWCE